MSLQITSRQAMIGIETKQGQMNIRQHAADMKIDTALPALDITAEPAVLYIDQSQCFAEAGLKDYRAFTRECAQKGMSRALEGIAKRASQGNALLDIHRGGNAIAAQAVENSIWREVDINIDMVPKSRPQIEVRRGEFHGELIKGKVDIKVRPRAPEIRYTPGDVSIYLRQKNQIQIKYVGNRLNTMV